MKYIIIGSKGFVGSNICIKLKDYTKFQVIGIDRKKIELLSKKSINKIKNFVNEGDVVVFCAAEAPVKNLDMFTNNVTMLNNILSDLANINIKSFIYLSSDAVYSDSECSIDEEYQTNPDNLHGMMHLTREKIIRITYPDKHLIVRPTLIYGYGDPHKGYGPNQFIDTAVNKGKIDIFGKGEELRDHIWIEDVSKILCELIVKDKTGIFNLVSGQLISFNEISDLIVSLLVEYKIKVDVSFKKRTSPMPHNGFRKLGNNKILNLLPETKISPFKNNIRNYVEKYLIQKNN